jgi:aspartyl-tRNA(Asn)/glutamyl-tRNA(Gln) amidotransferase subunit A
LFSFTSISQFHADIHRGATSCVQAVQHYINAIEANAHLNAFVEIYSEEALQRAKKLDASSSRGKLHGVVVGIKDNICYRDHSVTAASLILSGFHSLYSATAVERLLSEGAIIIGRQNCDEFGMGSTNENSTYGPVLNPVNISVVPGGSSGGSAASIKAGLCMASLGSDTGGSIRLPADFCGVVGYKPSYGRISRYGLLAYASSFDQIGILAGNVDDISLILSVISGPDEYDSTALPTELTKQNQIQNTISEKRIAYFPEWLEHPSVDPEIAAAIRNQIDVLSKKGHSIQPVPFPLTEFIVPAYYVLTTAEASSNLARYDGVRYGKSEGVHTSLESFYKSNRTHGFGQEVKRRIMLGTFVLSSGYFEAYYLKAQQVRQLLKKQTDLIFKDYDFILAPNSPVHAYPLGAVISDPLKMYLGDIFTVFANLTGIPSMSLPLFKHSSNLPFGLQVMSSPHNEVSLLRFSHHLMQQ